MYISDLVDYSIRSLRWSVRATNMWTMPKVREIARTVPNPALRSWFENSSGEGNVSTDSGKYV
jgi:hypothetical protein